MYLRPPGEGDEGTLGFFHRQLARAVRQKYLSDNTNEVASHRRLAKYFQRKADPDEKGLWGGNYPRALSELPYHFLQGKLHQSLFQAARDDTFLQAQANAFTEEPFVQLDTLQKALTGAAQIDDAAKMAEFMLRHAHRVMKIADVSLLDVLREKQIERALNLADLIFWRDKKRGTLSFLVLAWALKRQNRTRDAAKIMSDLAQRDLPGLAPYGWPELAAIALSHLADLDEGSFLSVQEQLLDADGKVTLCQKLLAKDQSQETYPPNDRLMDLVFQITESITVEHQRALVLADIAKIQAWGGRDKEAQQTAGKITDRYARAVVLTDITRAQATAGKDQKALETVREIGDEDDRVRALIAMAQVQVSMGREEEARQTFERALGIATEIDYSGMREPLLRDIAQAQAITGKLKEATRTVRKIRDEDDREKALVEIAK
ncbi:MAG TPA: hypothetical protein VMZ30_12680, partial [Pyrinomonadaceae bacterium]|nr:hypothetical protein [Pyrinomonadaceae bacterium]